MAEENGISLEERHAAGRSAALSDELLLRECEVGYLVASGPGGQHRNKTESGVRIKHLPSGVVVMATERRSQRMNLDAAIVRLREKLVRRSFVPKPRKKTKPSAGAKRRRVADKRKQGEKKRIRGRSGDED